MLNRFKKIFSKKDPPSVFGKPLEELPLNSNGIPIFFDIVCSKILNNITHKGIFRKCGDQNQIDLIGQLAANSDFQLPPTTDIDTLTSFLKKWLRELPESILMPPVIKKYFRSNDPNTGPIALQNLPPLNRKCLAVLFNIIKSVSDHSEVNSMPMNNLFVCVVPSIIQFSKTSDYGNNFTFQSIYASTISFLNDDGSDFDFHRHDVARLPPISPNNNIRTAEYDDSAMSQKRRAINLANYNPRRNQFRTCNANMLRQSRECPLIESNTSTQLQSCPEMSLNRANEINDNHNSELHPIESLPIPIYDDDVIVSKENSENSQEEVNKLNTNDDDTKSHKKHHKKLSKKRSNNNNQKQIEENKNVNEDTEKTLDNLTEQKTGKNDNTNDNTNDKSSKNEADSNHSKKHHKKHSKNNKKSKEKNDSDEKLPDDESNLTENKKKSKHRKKHHKKQKEKIDEKSPNDDDKLQDDENSQDNDDKLQDNDDEKSQNDDENSYESDNNQSQDDEKSYGGDDNDEKSYEEDEKSYDGDDNYNEEDVE